MQTEKTPKSSSGSPKHQSISAYQEVIDELSQMLLEEDWYEFKNNSTLLSTVRSGLRDAIKNIERLRKQGKEKSVDIDSILAALNNAHIALIQASIQLEATDIQERMKYPVIINNCRDNLNLASGLIPSTAK
jgi:hypothetical protein